MSRSFSLNIREAMNAQETGEIPVILLTVTHPNYDGTLRLSSDPTERASDVPLLYTTTSRGQVFNFVPMEIVWLDESQDGATRIPLVVSNVNRTLIPLLRTVVTPPKARLEMVFASALDEVEAATPQLDIINARYDASRVSFDLAQNAMVSEPFPSGSFDPASFPALF